jgi:hypothetical protein
VRSSSNTAPTLAAIPFRQRSRAGLLIVCKPCAFSFTRELEHPVQRPFHERGPTSVCRRPHPLQTRRR